MRTFCPLIIESMVRLWICCRQQMYVYKSPRRSMPKCCALIYERYTERSVTGKT